MNRCHAFKVFIFVGALALFASACGTFPQRADVDPKPDPKPAKVVCEPSARDRKPTAAPAPFLVEAFRCSMQPSPNLNIGIRIYSSLDGKETSLIYGPDRMDTPPLANDSFLYTGVKVVLAATSEGKTQYSFQHSKLSLQMNVPRSAAETAVFEAVYSDDAGANGIKGACTRVSTVTY